MTNAPSQTQSGQGTRRVRTLLVTSFEFGYPEKFVQDQCGHATASTTAIYSGVSDEYRNRLLTRAIRERNPGLWADHGDTAQVAEEGR